MPNFDPLEFEREMKRLRPAEPPQELVARLSGINPMKPARDEMAGRRADGFLCRLRGLLWLAPAAAALVLGAFLLRHQLSLPSAPPAQKGGVNPAALTSHAIRADQIEIDQQLVTAFDAIARLPGGVPVRFHCREWKDEIVVHDRSRGLVIERQAPRLEVVPVRFETY